MACHSPSGRILRMLAIALCRAGAPAEDAELHLSIDPLPKSYRLDVSGGQGDRELSGRHALQVAALADLTVLLPYDGFSDTVFPIGGCGFGYAYRRDDGLLDQALRLKFHYGLAYRPFAALRLDVQPFLAPQGSFASLPTGLAPAVSGRDWFLSGVAYGAEATVSVRLVRWAGLAVRIGVEGDYVSGSNSAGTTVTLRDGGMVAAATLILATD